MKEERPIWQRARTELFRDFACGEMGLASEEAAARLEKYGPNELQEGGKKIFAYPVHFPPDTFFRQLDGVTVMKDQLLCLADGIIDALYANKKKL